MAASRRLPPGLPPAGDVATPQGVLAEILALDRLRREGRIDERALQVGLEALELMGRGRARRHRRAGGNLARR